MVSGFGLEIVFVILGWNWIGFWFVIGFEVNVWVKFGFEDGFEVCICI